MNNIYAIRYAIQQRLITPGTYALDCGTTWTLTESRVILGYHFKSDQDNADANYRHDLIDNGPMLVIKPAEVTEYDVQTKLGLGKVQIVINIGMDPMSDEDFCNPESFISGLVNALTDDTNTFTAAKVSVLRPKVDSERTGIIEYVLELKDIRLC